MRSTGKDSLTLLRAGLGELAETDHSGWDDRQVQAALPSLLTAFNQLGAVIASVLATFDARGLSDADACRSARSWLIAFGRMSPAAATGWMSRANLLRDLPALRAGALSGAVSAEHVRKIAELAQRFDPGVVGPFDERS